MVSQSIIQCGENAQGNGSITQSFIGRQARIEQGLHLSSGCVIGDHARVETGVVLAEYTSIGLNAQVHSLGRLVPNVVPAFHVANEDGSVEPSYSRALSLNLTDAEDELFQSPCVTTFRSLPESCGSRDRGPLIHGFPSSRLFFSFSSFSSSAAVGNSAFIRK